MKEPTDDFMRDELEMLRAVRRATLPKGSPSLMRDIEAPEWTLAAERVNPRELKWQRNPIDWINERAYAETWSKQRDIIQSICDNPKTAVHSSHGIGKSFTAALTTCWWLDAHPPGEAFVVTTAPTDAQVKAVLWREINKLHARIGLRGRTNLAEWYIGKELVALGRKPGDHSPTAFQGIHARYVLVILDEACGIPKNLWDSASTLATNIYGRMLAIGNPDDPDSEFARMCDEGSGWNVIHVGTEDTPNFTGEPVSRALTEMLPSREWFEDRERAWGRDSAIFIAKCLGRFPKDASPFAVIPYGFATQCRYNELVEDTDVIEAGIDVGGGGDRTVIFERQGVRAGRYDEFRDPDPMKTVGRLVERINEWGVRKVKIDVIGIGWALSGRLRELSSRHNPSSKDTTHSAEVIPVNFAEKPSPGKEERYLNKRAEVWWEVGREKTRLGTWNLGTLSDDMIAELTTPMYEIMDSKGKIKIEPKDEIRKRLGRSPDFADALLLAFHEVVSQGSLSPGLGDLAARSFTKDLRPYTGSAS